MAALHTQLLNVRLGLQRRVELPPSFARRIPFSALVPEPSSTLVVLGFSRDGESILGVDGGSWLLAWPLALAAPYAPLRAADAARVLPLPPAPARDDDARSAPAPLVYVEGGAVCAAFARTFADDDDGAADWACAVAARPARARGALRFRGAATFVLSQCRGADAPSAAALRDLGEIGRASCRERV